MSAPDPGAALAQAPWHGAYTELRKAKMPRVRVKICGITNLADAKFAVDLGADALGFNFYEKSVRNISPADAYKIIRALPEKIEAVGVFVNWSPEAVIALARAVDLDTVQLHGDESAATARAARKIFPRHKSDARRQRFPPRRNSSRSNPRPRLPLRRRTKPANSAAPAIAPTGPSPAAPQKRTASSSPAASLPKTSPKPSSPSAPTPWTSPAASNPAPAKKIAPSSANSSPKSPAPTPTLKIFSVP